MTLPYVKKANALLFVTQFAYRKPSDVVFKTNKDATSTRHFRFVFRSLQIMNIESNGSFDAHVDYSTSENARDKTVARCLLA
jgi:hypothetical protein